jgi:hypothetical protein
MKSFVGVQGAVFQKSPLANGPHCFGDINSLKRFKKRMGRSKGHKSFFIPAHPRNWKDTERIAALCGVRLIVLKR